MKKGCGLCKRWGRGCVWHPDVITDKIKPGGKRVADLCGIRKRNGDLCNNVAGKGTTHSGEGPCYFHGGRLPSVCKKYERKRANEELILYGGHRQIDPHSALLEEITRTAGHVAWLEEKVRAHDEEEKLTWGITKEVIGGKDAGITKESKPSVWLQLYDRERKNLVDVCRIAIAAGIAEREVRIAETQGALIAQVIRGVLSDLGVDDRPQVETAIRKQLQLVGGMGGAS